jgi:hypothetical protein
VASEKRSGPITMQQQEAAKMKLLKWYNTLDVLEGSLLERQIVLYRLGSE